jgi:hypothetical protein
MDCFSFSAALEYLLDSDESRQLSASPFYKNTPGLCMIGDLIDPDSSASFCVDLDRRPR